MRCLLVLLIFCLAMPPGTAIHSQASPSADASTETEARPADPAKLRSKDTFLLMLTGDPFATPQNATRILDELGSRIGALVLGKDKVYESAVCNEANAARALIQANTPAFGIVTPDFYFANKTTIAMETRYEAARHGFSTEQYTLFVADENLKLADLNQKKVATMLASDSGYLLKLVLDQSCKPSFEACSDLSLAAARMANKDAQAADAVLCDRATCADIEATPHLKSVLHPIHTSAELNHPFLVFFTDYLKPGEAALLDPALFGMNDDEDGRGILGRMGIDAWIEVNAHLVQHAEQVLASPPPKAEKKDEQKPASGENTQE